MAADGGGVLKGNPWLDHLSKPRLEHLRVIILAKADRLRTMIEILTEKGFKSTGGQISPEILLFVSLWQEKGSKYDGLDLSSIIQQFFNYVTCGSPKQCK